ncbi:MAG: PEGA domain-containing protein [Deltaproteobacteria bacterium]|nr:PEGA domain-containing protein [Deltaproteobacteria bacterium]
MRSVAFGFLLMQAGAALAADKLSVAILDLRHSQGLDAQLARSLTDVIPQALDEMGAFKSISMQEIKQMLALEQTKQLLGCDDVSCLAELGGALGTEYMISGSVAVAGGGYLVQLQLANVPRASVENRVSRDYTGGAGGLAAEVRTATKILVSKLLSARSGKLLLTVSETGASVKVDGVIVGTTPLDALDIAGGMHTITLEKEGFIRFSKDVDIQSNAEARLEVALRPATDLVNAYQRSAERTRGLALSSITAGVVGVAAGGTLYFLASGRENDLAKKAKAYQAGGSSDRALHDEIQSDKKELAVLDVATVAAAGFGVAALATGLILFITGDDPDRYETSAPAVPAFGFVGVTPTGVVFGGSF